MSALHLGPGLHLSLSPMSLALGKGGFSLDAFMAAQSDGLFNRFTLTDRLFQENTGPTPANDPGEVIGLALSQRIWGGKALAQIHAEQPELAPNGTFTNGTTGWEANGTGASIAAEGGALRVITPPDGSFGGAHIAPNLLTTVGRTYRVSFDLLEVSGGMRVNFGGMARQYTTPGSQVEYVTATTVERFNLVRHNVGVQANFLIDNVSIKEIPGKHSTQPTLGFRPKFQISDAAFDGVDDHLVPPYLPGPSVNFMAAKVTVPATISATQIIAGLSGNSDGSGRFFLAVNTAGHLCAGVGAQSISTFVEAVDRKGQQVVLGISFDGANAHFFVGEELVYSGAQNGVVPTTQPVCIGGKTNHLGGSDTFFGGVIHSLVAGREFIDLAKFKQIAANL